MPDCINSSIKSDRGRGERLIDDRPVVRLLNRSSVSILQLSSSSGITRVSSNTGKSELNVYPRMTERTCSKCQDRSRVTTSGFSLFSESRQSNYVRSIGFVGSNSEVLTLRVGEFFFSFHHRNELPTRNGIYELIHDSIDLNVHAHIATQLQQGKHHHCLYYAHFASDLRFWNIGVELQLASRGNILILQIRAVRLLNISSKYNYTPSPPCFKPSISGSSEKIRVA